MPDDEADLNSLSGSASYGPGADARPVADRMSEAESMELLGNGGLARLVYNGPDGPTALPVVYKIDAGSIVLGTWDPVLFDEDLRTGIAQAEYQVVVEVDQVHPEAHEGWVVLVRGTAHHVDTQAERASISNVGLESWVEAEPEHFIRVVPISISGQRLHSA